MTPSFRGVSARNLAECLRETSWRKNIVCANLREISRSFLRESSCLRTFVRGVNAKKELFSWADLYMYKIIKKNCIKSDFEEIILKLATYGQREKVFLLS